MPTPSTSPQLVFTPFSDHKPDLIVSLLTRSYADFFNLQPYWQEVWLTDWAEYDAAIFANPGTVGACGFVSCVQDQPVGFASWNPREFPTTGIIGHNCIIPAFRGYGFGKHQIEEVLRRFQIKQVNLARVTTGAHPFFEPAQRMYTACGFHEVGRRVIVSSHSYEVIDYEMMLTSHSLL